MAEESWKRGAEGTGCQAPENHCLCANNCGLFGSPTTMNLCSKCYRDLHLKKYQESSMKSAMEKPLNLTEESSKLDQANPLREAVITIIPSSTFSSLSFSSSSAVVDNSLVTDSSVYNKANRCTGCKKRVGLMGFKCRCGSTFCASHRLPEKHVCTFDFKTAGREAIARANPVVIAPKLEKI